MKRKMATPKQVTDFIIFMFKKREMEKENPMDINDKWCNFCMKWKTKEKVLPVASGKDLLIKKRKTDQICLTCAEEYKLNNAGYFYKNLFREESFIFKNRRK